MPLWLRSDGIRVIVRCSNTVPMGIEGLRSKVDHLMFVYTLVEELVVKRDGIDV
jgi:hypothetical protein